MDLKKIRIKNVKLECKEGGTTVLTMLLQAHPTDKEVGMMYALMASQQEVTLWFGGTVSEDDEDSDEDDAQPTLNLGEGGARAPAGDDRPAAH